MDHHEALEHYEVERYLLDEMGPEEREAFEEHFFDCQQCAGDLRAGAAFIDGARKEFARPPSGGLAPAPKDMPRRRPLGLVLALSSLAACLLVIAYQNLAVYPRLRTEIAQLQGPEILPALSLVGGNSRGGAIPELTIGSARSFLLSLDLPTQDRFSSYSCGLYSGKGEIFWHVDIPAPMARDTVSIRVPSPGELPGRYTLVVQGRGDGAPVDLARYPFVLRQ